jgi:hypothetical protein
MTRLLAGKRGEKRSCPDNAGGAFVRIRLAQHGARRSRNLSWPIYPCQTFPISPYQTFRAQAAPPLTSSCSERDAKGLARVASPAITKSQVTAEGASPVMTGHAAQGTPGREVLRGARRADLLRLRKTRSHLVAVRTGQALSRSVLGVAETGAEGTRDGRRASVGGGRVTGSARAYVAPGSGLAAGCMADVALVMRGESGRNGERRAATRGPIMTACAPLRRPGRVPHVLRVIELHIEALVESFGKRPQGGIGPIDVRMADRAHGNLRGDELREVAAGTGFVARKLWRSRVARGALVAGRALKRNMARRSVRELAVILGQRRSRRWPGRHRLQMAVGDQGREKSEACH